MSLLSVVLLYLAASAALPLILRRARRRLPPGHDATGHVCGRAFSLFATLYAFFIGFSIVTLWSQFTTAKTMVSDEANALHSACQMSQGYGDAEPFRRAVVEYAQCVVDKEWPVMESREEMSLEAVTRFNRIWSAYRLLKAENPSQVSLYSAIGASIATASERRNVRAAALSGNLYPLVWVILSAGFAATLVSLYLLNPANSRGKSAMEFFLIFMLLACVFLIYDISTPFSGHVKVESAPFQALLKMQP